MKKRINVTIDEKMLKVLDDMAKERGIDRSTMLSIMIYDSKVIVDLQKEAIENNYAKDSFLVM